MLDSERLDGVIEKIKEIHGKKPEWPMVFSGPIELMPSGIAEQAAKTAAMREYSGELVSKSKRLLSLVEGIFMAMEHDVVVAVDQEVDAQGQKLIARGYAWPERSARANLSVLDRKVDLRGVELKLKNAQAMVKEIEDCYQAWRDTEWALDRQVRLLQLRHALGEV